LFVDEGGLYQRNGLKNAEMVSLRTKKGTPIILGVPHFGGGDTGIRTPDLLHAMQAL